MLFIVCIVNAYFKKSFKIKTQLCTIVHNRTQPTQIPLKLVATYLTFLELISSFQHTQCVYILKILLRIWSPVIYILKQYVLVL